MFIFGKKKEIRQVNEELLEEVNKLNYQLNLNQSNQKELINDFIGILEQIQQTNNENLQWKKRQCRINNEIILAIENYENKIMELDINSLTI